MHRHTLTPVVLDPESVAERNIEVSRVLLAPREKITLLTVLERVAGFVQTFVALQPRDHLPTRIKSKLDAVEDAALSVTTPIEMKNAGVRIGSFPKEISADLIIAGSHHPAAQDDLLRSTTTRVSRRAVLGIHPARIGAEKLAQ